MLLPVQPSSSHRYTHVLACLLILAAAVGHVAYLGLACPLDLAPDEAHYWDWSRHLDWSYYSKGPLVAWLIRASCELFGAWSEQHTGSLAFAIRLPAVLCGALLLTSLYVLSVQVFGRPRLALGLICGALTVPLITAGSTLMTIDAPYTCFWGWALVFAYRAVKHNGIAWEATGVCIGLGILAKYTMVLFLPSLALFLLCSKSHRKLLFSGGFWSMTGIALVCCLPILIWNSQHDWVTFQHVRRLAGLVSSEESFTPKTPIHWLGPLKYVAVQSGILLGYWFIVWLVAMIVCNPLHRRDEGIAFLWWLSAPMFLLFLAFSLKTGGGEPNWPVTAYISGGVLATGWLATCLESPKTWLRSLTALFVAVTGIVGLSATAMAHQSQWMHPIIEQFTGPPTEQHPFPVRRFDPTCRLKGWRTLAACVDEQRERLRCETGHEPVLAGGGWSFPGQLGVYCQGHPRVYSVGLLQGDRHSQYDFWPGPIDNPEPFLGKTFIIVGGLGPDVASSFERLEPPIWVQHQENGRPVAGWHIFICHNFKGFPRPNKEKIPH